MGATTQAPWPHDPAVGARAGGRDHPVVNRRAFVAGSLGLLAAPLAAEGQQRPSVARVAFLEGGNLESDLWQATRDGLRELGYVEGKNLIIEYRSASGQFDRVPSSSLS